MTHSSDHTNRELASRLVAAADGITNSAAAGLERDLREAARRLAHTDGALPVMIPAFVSELSKIANTTTDDVTRERLRRFLGEA
jgi:hypothetical protein